MNYKEANALLKGRSSKKLCNNTYLQRRVESGAIAVMLHETDVLTLNPDGSTILDSGGWETATTKDRINSYLQFGQVWSKRKEWSLYVNGKPTPFQDGIRIGPRGGVSVQRLGV